MSRTIIEKLGEDNAIQISIKRYLEVAKPYKPKTNWQALKLLKYVSIVRTEGRLQLVTHGFKDEDGFEYNGHEVMYSSNNDGEKGLKQILKNFDTEIEIFSKYGKVVYNAGEI